jgi:hypothetical protein
VSRAAPSRSHEPEAPPSSPRPPPRAHRRRSPPRNSAPSPWAAPSQPPLAKLSLPLELPALARAKPPSLGPRTGPPAASRRQASPAAGSSPSLGRFATPSGRDTVSPPRSRWQVGPQQRRHPRSRAVSPSLLGRHCAESASARARARGGPKAVSPAQERGILFSFSFSTLFSHLNSFLNILCTKNYQKGFPRLHTIMLLENDTL